MLVVGPRPSYLSGGTLAPMTFTPGQPRQLGSPERGMLKTPWFGSLHFHAAFLAADQTNRTPSAAGFYSQSNQEPCGPEFAYLVPT